MQKNLSPGKTGILLIFLLACLPAWSQNKDSLWAVWSDRTKADTVRLDAVDYIAYIHSSNSNADSTLLMADLEYTLAKKLRLEKYAVRALTRKADAYGQKDDDVKAHYYYQQSLTLSKKEN